MTGRIHRNAAHRLQRRAQSRECTLLEAEGGHRRRSCRSLGVPCGLCLGEPSCTPSCPPPQERPNNIGHKRYCCNIAPMPSAPKSLTSLQQLLSSSSCFHLPPNSELHLVLSRERSAGVSNRPFCDGHHITQIDECVDMLWRMSPGFASQTPTNQSEIPQKRGW